MPERIQRKRTKGWRMPPNTVYVGRPTVFGNPFYVGFSLQYDEWAGTYSHVESEEEAVLLFRERCGPEHRWIGFDDLARIRGKDLACWCPLTDADGNRVPCHADVLLEWANREGEHGTAD